MKKAFLKNGVKRVVVIVSKVGCKGARVVGERIKTTTFK